MADELQALLDRISEEELKKADAQCAKLLADAKAEAEAIIATARKDAAALQEKAQKEADMLVEKGKESLRQAYRDLLISLRAQFEARISRSVESLMGNTLKGTELADILAKVIIGFKKSDGAVDDLKILLNPADLSVVESAVKATVSEDLRQHCELAPAPGITGGFKVIFKDNGVVYDFTDKSLAESVCGSVNPKLAAMISE